MGLGIRPLQAADEPAVLELLAGTLGWLPDAHHAAFFAWKHRENPFGSSPAWVATEGGTVLGFRTFLRWELQREGRVIHAVRAVDTATAPGHQGKGIFSRLTRHAVDELRTEGIAFVFNTPNDRSRPGYLKLGWQALGRVRLAVRPRTPAAVVRMVTSRAPATMWSTPSGAGVQAADALADQSAVEALLDSQPPGGTATRRSWRYLQWRYAGFAPLGYRALSLAAGADDGFALFRLRRRGRSTEATIVELLVPGGDQRVATRLARMVLRASGADYAICGHNLRAITSGFAPLPGVGPVLTWRPLADDRRPDLASWHLAIGDVELL